MLADRLELTRVEGDYEGDTFFPPFEHLLGTEFELRHREPRDGFRFETWVRKAGFGDYTEERKKLFENVTIKEVFEWSRQHGGDRKG